jgi:hypothetical protein
MTFDRCYRHAARACAAIAFSTILCSTSARAGLLLTEIHYNGPAAGTDPDEFLELSNSAAGAVALDGYTFSAGITFSFSAGSSIDAGDSLVLARDPAGFLGSFPTYGGALFDFAGALSNSGETLQLLDASGDNVWTVDYDDGAPWPTGADGGGDSLQLRVGGHPANAADWFAAPPTPGRWAGSAAGPAQPVSGPAPALLLPVLFLALARRDRARRGRAAPSSRGVPPRPAGVRA